MPTFTNIHTILIHLYIFHLPLSKTSLIIPFKKKDLINFDFKLYSTAKCETAKFTYLFVAPTANELMPR